MGLDDLPAEVPKSANLIPFDRSWHRAKTKRQLTVTIDHTGTVTVTTATGQTRTVMPYDYRMHDAEAETTSKRPPRRDEHDRRAR